jgi:catechol 2,3-dioxygenase-like lactoylglutathione lyase family enzyme
MPILLNHTIVPARDKVASARFFARIMGLEAGPTMGHFAPVRVNDTLTFDFDNRDGFESHHYAFQVSDAEFDAIFGRIQAEGIKYGSQPWSAEDGQINNRRGGRGVYFADLDGHMLELMTVDQSR